jgi:hypothetical protein
MITQNTNALSKCSYFNGLTCFSKIEDIGNGVQRKKSFIGMGKDNWFTADDVILVMKDDPEDDLELMVRICNPVWDEWGEDV